MAAEHASTEHVAEDSEPAKSSRRSSSAKRRSKEAIRNSRLLQRPATPFGGERRVMAASAVGPTFAGLRNLLPEQVSYFFRRKVDFVEVEGEMPISGVSADWSWHYVRDNGCMCSEASILFDETNPNGGKVWGPHVKGTIVVAVRGKQTFETMARNADGAGAVGLVVVNNKVAWDESFEMCLDSTGFAGLYLTPPKVPAVLVPKSAKELLCSGRTDLRGKLVRR